MRIPHGGLNENRFSKSSSLNYWIVLTFDRAVLEMIEHVLMRWIIAYLAGNNARILCGGLLVMDLVNLIC